MANTPSDIDFIENTYTTMRAARAGKGLDALALELSFNLFHTSNRAEHVLSDLAQSCGLTFAGFNVLAILSHQRDAGMPLHEIGRLLLVSRANVTGLIDSLEGKGLVERVDHATDRRVYLARITDKGQSLLNTHRPLYFSTVAHMSSGLSATEKKSLIALLKKWRANIADPRKEA
jgi:MarR family 2-MHQ and catechol resistance regulon transcriptional repressor